MGCGSAVVGEEGTGELHDKNETEDQKEEYVLQINDFLKYDDVGEIVCDSLSRVEFDKHDSNTQYYKTLTDQQRAWLQTLVTDGRLEISVTENPAEIMQVAHVFEQTYPKIKVYYDNQLRALQTVACDPFEADLFTNCSEMLLGQACEYSCKAFDGASFLINYFHQKQLPHFCHQLIFKQRYFRAITVFYQNVYIVIVPDLSKQLYQSCGISIPGLPPKDWREAGATILFNGLYVEEDYFDQDSDSVMEVLSDLQIPCLVNLTFPEITFAEDQSFCQIVYDDVSDAEIVRQSLTDICLCQFYSGHSLWICKIVHVQLSLNIHVYMFVPETQVDCYFVQAKISAQLEFEYTSETKFLSYPVGRLYHTLRYNYWVVEQFCNGLDQDIFPEKCFSTDGEQFILHHLLAGGNKLSQLQTGNVDIKQFSRKLKERCPMLIGVQLVWVPKLQVTAALQVYNSGQSKAITRLIETATKVGTELWKEFKCFLSADEYILYKLYSQLLGVQCSISKAQYNAKAFNWLMTQQYAIEYDVYQQHITTVYQVALGLMQQICRGADLSFHSGKDGRFIAWKAYDGTSFNYYLERNVVPRELAMIQVSLQAQYKNNPIQLQRYMGSPEVTAHIREFGEIVHCVTQNQITSYFMKYD